MPFNKSRYITVCQQLLVTATVLAVGVTAAGVVTLDIVGPQPDAGTGLARDLTAAVDVHPAYVDQKAITPKVREVTLDAAAPAGGATRADARSVAPDTAKGTPAPRPDSTPSHGSQRSAPVVPSAPRATIHGLPVALTSAPEAVAGYATVGVTWAPGTEPAEDQIAFQVRTLTGETWSSWQQLQYHDDHGPDASDDADNAHARPGTDALVVGDVDQVQMRVAAAGGRVPAGLQLALINPGRDDLTKEKPAIDTAKLPASDASATGAPIEDTSKLATPAAEQAVSRPGSSVALSAMKVAPKPQIFSRAQWGANEKLREQGPPDYGTIKTGFVHHTVNANNYTRKDVPALIRGIYAYHVISRGWRDIGYNFLVDRFGRIWEGRYGGVDRPVIGAHTLGFNDVSFAMSAIGNYDIAEPPKVLLDAYARLFAWKLSMYNIKANATGIRLRGYTLHAINGHRDVGQTACPGRYLYAKLPYIRTEARQIQIAAQTGGSTPTPTPTPTAYNPLKKTPYGPAQPRMSFPRTSNIMGNATQPDLVAQRSDGSLYVLRTGGMVGFRPAVASTGAWAQMSRIVAVGDVTGDGNGDVMARTRGSRSWAIYRGDGAGHISARPVAHTRPMRHVARLFSAGDWNRDGRADLVGIDRRNGSLYLYPGAPGVGAFGKRRLLARNWTRFAQTAVAGDLNGDKVPDVVALTPAHGLYVALGSASGRLRPARWVQTLSKAYNGLSGAGDLTGDRAGDVLVRNRWNGTALILAGNGTGGFGHPYGPFPGMGGLRQMSGAQLAGGKRPDILGRVGNRLEVLANNDLVNLRRPVSAHLRTSPTTAIYTVGDWNGDGLPDLVSRQRGGDVLMLHLGLGHGRFRPGRVMSTGWSRLTMLAAVGDVTGDGRPDLMGRQPSGAMRIFPSDGRSGFLPAIKTRTAMRTFNQMGPGSWDPRPRADSTIDAADGSFVPLAGVVKGTSSPLRTVAASLKSTYDWVIGPGDVNGDGRPDLLGRQRSDNTLWLIPGTATGFGPRQFVGSGLGKYRLAD
ncbi:FG-GAP-like repeat-containing protein [Nocardioides terrisoli]|uniref:FG-GAP-like repeat-containing protein n=1 Tax=Nocardioides terrisoli TaxID=3388267 RepID=UPI00287B797C|nr:FG-GAP-like repeat-containing protein [Nocardioides marmorisolisilvae]